MDSFDLLLRGAVLVLVFPSLVKAGETHRTAAQHSFLRNTLTKLVQESCHLNKASHVDSDVLPDT